MEKESNHEPEEDDGIETAASNKPKRRSKRRENFVAALHRIMGGGAERQTGEGSNLFERLKHPFRTIFPKYVEKEPIPENLETENAVAEQAGLPIPEPLAAESPPPKTSELDITLDKIKKPSAKKAKKTEKLDPAIAETGKKEKTPKTEKLPADVEPESEREKTTNPVAAPERRSVASSGLVPIERIVYERQASMPENIYNINARDRKARGLAAVGVVGLELEHHGRKKADRKLARADRKIDAKVSGLKQETASDQNRIEKLEQAAARQQEVNQQTEIWRRAFEHSSKTEARSKRQEASQAADRITDNTQHGGEKTVYLNNPSRHESKPNQSAGTPERTSLPEPAKLEKMTVEKIERLVRNKEPIEKILHPERFLARPEAALQLEQIEAAADSNIALEGLYERSHEIKDDPSRGAYSSSGQHGGAASTIPAAPPPLGPVLARAQAAQRPKKSHSPQTSIPPLYRQAARNGAWGAGFVLAFLAVAFLI